MCRTVSGLCGTVSRLALTCLTLCRTVSLNSAAVPGVLRTDHKRQIFLLWRRGFFSVSFFSVRSALRTFCRSFSSDLFSHIVLDRAHMILDLHVFLLKNVYEFFIIHAQLFGQFMYPHFSHINYLLYAISSRSLSSL